MASSHTQPCVITAHRASSSSWHQAIHHHVASLPIGLLSHHGIKPYTTMCHHCPSCFFLIMASSHTPSCVITAHRASPSPSSWHRAIHNHVSSLPIVLLPHHGIKPYTTMCHHCPSGFFLSMASSHTPSSVITAHRASLSSWHQAIHNHVSSLPIGLLPHHGTEPYSSPPIGLLPHHGTKPYSSPPIGLLPHHGTKPYSSPPIGLLPPPHHGVKPHTIWYPHCPSGFFLIMASSHTQSCVITTHRASYSLRHHSHTHLHTKYWHGGLPIYTPHEAVPNRLHDVQSWLIRFLGHGLGTGLVLKAL